jgi:hypothetical protein
MEGSCTHKWYQVSNESCYVLKRSRPQDFVVVQLSVHGKASKPQKRNVRMIAIVPLSKRSQYWAKGVAPPSTENGPLSEGGQSELREQSQAKAMTPCRRWKFNAQVRFSCLGPVCRPHRNIRSDGRRLVGPRFSFPSFRQKARTGMSRTSRLQRAQHMLVA